MKTGKLLLGMLLFVLGTFSFMGCNDEMTEEDGWYDSIPDGGFFLRANTIRFYYIDGEGKSLIAPEDPATLPVSCDEELADPMEKTIDYNKEQGCYNGNHNWIYYDKDEKLYYCSVTAYGDEKFHTYSFPIYVNGDKDTMEITYKYTDKDVLGGKYWSKIISWKYNGVHIYSDDDELYKKVFIKKVHGKTTVSLTR
ncbi:MAG: hypothetical protein EGP90_13625 [Bacteroides sp.]|mgnify:FL=1|nr:hypothetical protein [Bacteroides sp.]